MGHTILPPHEAASSDRRVCKIRPSPGLVVMLNHGCYVKPRGGVSDNSGAGGTYPATLGCGFMVNHKHASSTVTTPTLVVHDHTM